eukprot:scaffold808_cov196-Alexandrium_tamarense.AAC.121
MEHIHIFSPLVGASSTSSSTAMGYWRACFASFQTVHTAPTIRPNFAVQHYHQQQLRYNSVLNLFGEKSEGEELEAFEYDERTPRIAVIGGGIAGVTVANALSKSISREHKIVVFEGDNEGGHRSVNFNEYQQPVWLAERISNIDNFDVVPPYFALHLIRCLGPSATWDEAASFVTFLRHFVVASITSGETEANERGRLLQLLARSNRLIFLDTINSDINGKALAGDMGIGKGFLSLHRSEKAAMHALDECKMFKENAALLPIDDATKLEPRIANLPMFKNLFVVHRTDDYTANSAVFVHHLVNKIKAIGVEYRCGEEGGIKDVIPVNSKRVHTQTWKKMPAQPDTPLATAPSANEARFKITTNDGSTHDFDYVVLAAGVNSPLVARMMSLGNYCPTYPLRGYSLTAYTKHTNEKDAVERRSNGMSANLLNKPISVDDMYCSSVGVNMARIAGFGELVGYRDKAKDVPSLAPSVMARYARTLFPDSDASEEKAAPCFRPLSPDDIPLVGEVSSTPGLYLHTGHGTLGWTLCLATAECIAQAMCEDIRGTDKKSTYELPGDVIVERSKLSPNRFV